MDIEQRLNQLEKKIKTVEDRHRLEDEESLRVKAAITQAAKKGIKDLLTKQAK